jgi:hypothetical protein
MLECQLNAQMGIASNSEVPIGQLVKKAICRMLTNTFDQLYMIFCPWLYLLWMRFASPTTNVLASSDCLSNCQRILTSYICPSTNLVVLEVSLKYQYVFTCFHPFLLDLKRLRRRFDSAWHVYVPTDCMIRQDSTKIHGKHCCKFNSCTPFPRSVRV